MSSIFSKIVAGEIPCHKVAENEHFLAFLDVAPLAEGHTLVIPKKEVDYLFDLEDDLYSELLLFAKRTAIAIKEAYPCPKIGMSVIGLEVPHCHIHLSPLKSVNSLNFSNPKLKLTSEELACIAEKIASKFQ